MNNVRAGIIWFGNSKVHQVGVASNGGASKMCEIFPYKQNILDEQKSDQITLQMCSVDIDG